MVAVVGVRKETMTPEGAAKIIAVFQAIDNPDRDMTAVLQPVVRVSPSGNSLYGYEGLIRVRGPRGVVFPDEAVQIAHQYGIGPNFEVAAIRKQFEAVRDARRRLNHDGPLRLSVNVSHDTLLSKPMRALMADRPDDVELTLELVEKGLPTRSRAGRNPVDVRELAKTIEQAMQEYGVPVICDDIDDIENGMQLAGNLRLRGAHVAGFKLSNSKTRGLEDGKSTNAYRSVLGAVALALGVERDELRLVVEGVENERAVESILEMLEGMDQTDQAVFAQGWRYPYVVGRLGDRHRDAAQDADVEIGSDEFWKMMNLPGSDKVAKAPVLLEAIQPAVDLRHSFADLGRAREVLLV
jgi:EAL domain-containing protein (putative c-di-GMP-specific phosphodiesterase class I)